MTSYPAALLNSLINFNSYFLRETFIFSMYNIVSSANKDSTTSFWFECLLFHLFCLVSQAKTSSAMLITTGESEHSCFVSNLRKIFFRFLILSIMLAVDLSYMAFIMLQYINSILNLLRTLFIKGYQMLFLHLLKWSWFCPFFCLFVCFSFYFFYFFIFYFNFIF